MAASLRKKLELARLASSTSNPQPTLDDAVESETTPAEKSVANIQLLDLLEPAITIIGNKHKVYYAYPSSIKGDVEVLGPDRRFGDLTTTSVQGIFKLARFYGRMLEWGFDREEVASVDKGLWGCFLGLVLDTLGKRGRQLT